MVRVTLVYDLDAFVDEGMLFERQASCIKHLSGMGRKVRAFRWRGRSVYASQSGMPAGFITTIEWDREAAYREAMSDPWFVRLVEDVRRSPTTRSCWSRRPTMTEGLGSGAI